MKRERLEYLLDEVRREWLQCIAVIAIVILVVVFSVLAVGALLGQICHAMDVQSCLGIPMP